ncbi:hypothetical protein GCM10011351_25450 [Paraliobacillus quinghaiensis]|uniref:PsbP C-terminal domain-containing protein n=1 Tax=Paraliobacillus quinghaiensis TaxID=470815 RepID=A0A917WW51_9BACI|nr:hypothetical protein [Paraliobacillus quinghaiensis]GGM38227.1 hypothetical protein GCM10011351_25450 [Paraliobacillus quinghaiensis]
MTKKWHFAFILFFITTLLVGCNGETESDNSAEVNQKENVESEENELLYVNEAYGISIAQNADWTFESEVVSANLNVVLSHNKLEAIISTVSADRTFEEIKQELKSGAGDVEVISEEGHTLSYKSKLKNAVRTDVYFKEHNDSKNLIIIFMSPNSEYEQAKPNIKSLLNHIN